MILESKELSAEQLAQHPVLLMLLAGLILFVLLLLLASLSFWVWAGLRWYKGIPILTVQPWQPRVWGLIDLVVVVVVWVSSQILVVRLSRHRWGGAAGQVLSEDQMPLSVMALLGIANLVTVGFAILWISVRHQASLSQFGLGLKNFRRNCLIGVVAAVAALPVIHVMMLSLTQGTNTEYNHPLIKMMMNNATLSAYLLGCFSAVLAAPLAEEFIFRVVLQGWLQSIEYSKTHAHWMLGAAIEDREKYPGDCLSESPSEPPMIVAASSDGQTERHVAQENPYWVGNISGSEEPVRTSLWPVLVAGTLFGIAHYGYGLSYIPLTAMGIVLGLLFRATGSILPSLIVHVVLNAFSMYALGVAILYQQAAASH